MMYLIRKIIALVIVSFCIPISFYAQGKNFIYIQSDKKQVYYVILNSKINSSTPEGYIILSQIPTGKSLLTIRFPRNLYPEQKYILDIKEDRGFSLKKNNNNTWQLFDLNSFTLTNPVTNIDSVLSSSKKVMDENLKTSDTIGVVKDLPIQIEVTKSVTIDSIQLIQKKGTVIPLIEPLDILKTKSLTITSDEVKKKNSIKIIIEKHQTSGIDKIYTDSSSAGIDTIGVYIPIATDEPKITKITTVPVTEIGVLHPEKLILTEEEFRKLRLNMASAATDEDMIAVAVKGTNNKLMAVRQIRNLSSLFLNENNKLSFFKAIKNNTKDLSNFSSLEGELSESKNIVAFKALLNN